LRVFLSLLVSLFFFSLFLYFVPVEELLGSLKGISPSSLLLAFFLYCQLTRSIRWSILLGLPLRESFFLNSANIFFNTMLPARSGELSWFYYAKRLGIRLSYSLWSFLVGRAYDLLALVLTVIFFLLWSEGRHFLAFGTLFFSFLLSPFFVFVRELLPGRGKPRELKSFLRREFSPLLSFKLLFLSFLSFMLKGFACYLVVREVSTLELSLFFLGFFGGELSSVLPLHGFMGYGTYEAGFLLPLKVAGESLEESLKAGFVAHSFLVLSSSLWGLIALLYLHKPSRRAP